MTYRNDAARGADVLGRWRMLAEQRLDHLTELFESGRWRRYHSERAFLENIREAKSAVETWRGLLIAEASPDNLPIDLSWIGKRSSVPPARRDVPAEPMIAPQLAELPEAPRVSVVPNMIGAEPVHAAEAAEAPEESTLDKTLTLTLDIVAMQDRYPLLRNT